MNALQLFRAGYDYIAIAKYFKTTEAEIEKEVHDLRNQERRPKDRFEQHKEILRQAEERSRAYAENARDRLLAIREMASS